MRHGPDVTLQLAYDEELIRVGHQILAPRFSARNLLSLLCQAVHRGEVTNSAAEPGVFGTYGKKDTHERY